MHCCVVLTRLYGAAEGREKLAEIDASLAEDHHRPRFSDLLDSAMGRVRKLVWIGIGLATFQQLVGINVAFYYGAVLAANLYVVFFNGSWGPVMWVMLGEMFPNQIRGSGLAVSGLAQWGSNFGITMTFPILLGSIGLMGAYSLYALAAVVSVYFVIRYVHETRGLELEQMEG